MNDWILNNQSKNAFRDIPEGKINAIMAGINSYEKQDRIQAVILAISEGYKIGYKRSEENAEVRRNIERSKRKCKK